MTANQLSIQFQKLTSIILVEYGPRVVSSSVVSQKMYAKDIPIV